MTSLLQGKEELSHQQATNAEQIATYEQAAAELQVSEPLASSYAAAFACMIIQRPLAQVAHREDIASAEER